MESEYWPKCSDALWLGVQGGIYECAWWQVRLRDPSLADAIHKRLRDGYDVLYKSVGLLTYLLVLKRADHCMQQY